MKRTDDLHSTAYDLLDRIGELEADIIQNEARIFNLKQLNVNMSKEITQLEKQLASLGTTADAHSEE